MFRSVNSITVHNTRQTKVTDLKQSGAIEIICQTMSVRTELRSFHCTNSIRTLSEQSSFNKIFAGFKSLWITENECMYLRPASI